VANVIAALSRFAFPSQRSTRTNPAVISTAGTPQLVVTVDKDANNEALRRIHEWFAGVNLAQILYLTTGTNHLMIQGRDGTGINGTYVPVDYEGMRFLQAKPIDFKEHADPNQIIVVCGKKQS